MRIVGCNFTDKAIRYADALPVGGIAVGRFAPAVGKLLGPDFNAFDKGEQCVAVEYVDLAVLLGKRKETSKTFLCVLLRWKRLR